MQEQPPSDPPHREPTAKARRSRSPRPTFSPPPTPEPPPTDVTGDTPPRRRARGAAPTVLFQPPTPAADVPPAPRPRPAAEPSPTDPGPPAAAPEPTDPGTPAEPTPPTASETAEPTPDETPPAAPAPASAAAPQRARRAPAAKKAAPKTPATTRKTAIAPEFTAPDRTDPSPTEASEVAVEEAGPAPRPVRARRSTKTAPAAKTSPAKRAAKQSPAEPRPDAAAGDEPMTRPAPARKRTGATVERPAALIVGPDVPGPDPDRPEGTERKQAEPEPAAPEPAEPEQHKPEPTAPEPTGHEPAAPEQHARAERKRSDPEAAGAAVATDARTPVEGWRAVGPRLRDHPGFAPELLALAAVDALGPRARGWVEQVRRAYPAADADGVARLATRRFVRMAGTGGALAAGAGVFAPAAELAVVLWTQANLVLHLAAAYGRDPAHPDRAAELLVLTSVHPDDGTARAALAAARAADVPTDGPWGRTAEAAWRLATPVAAQAGGWLGLRLAARLLPGAAVLAAVTGGTAAAERVAARAVAHYRTRTPSRGTSADTRAQSQPNQDFGSSA
ncbi:hypothetical protein ACH495_00045 [Micromonospora sp. NPDC018662]|uniref:hypothetical protein n=1 Tax=Micromonospora sp. NPDC018662 TaxID=3364238 RepID=UPI00379FD5D8